MAEPNGDLTPEKRLLELIEGSAGVGESGKPAEKIAEARRGSWKALVSVEELKNRFSLLKAGLVEKFRHHQSTFGLTELNQVLRFVVIVLAVFFLGDFLFQLTQLNRRVIDEAVLPEVPEFELSYERPNVESSEGLEFFDLGKMFMPYGKRLEEAERMVKEQSARLLDLAAKLKLTGISYNPEESARAFCMIEDIEKNITSFLREGDLLGSLRVKKIREDSVLLESQGETVELR